MKIIGTIIISLLMFFHQKNQFKIEELFDKQNIIQNQETILGENKTVIPEKTWDYKDLSDIDEEIQKICFLIAKDYQISPELLIAIIERESAGKINATNKNSGCIGLMQLNPKYINHYLERIEKTDAYDMETNIRIGCEILKDFQKIYSELPLVLMKYHGEKTAIEKFKSGDYSEYCIGIIKRMKEMQLITGGQN